MRRLRVLVTVLGFATLAVGAASPAAADAPPRIVVTTAVTPAGAGPGSSVTQTIQVANDGDGVAVLLVVTADLVPGCRWVFTVLLPRQARTETCSGVVAAGVNRLTVSVSGRTRAGDPVQTSKSVQLRAPMRQSAPTPPAASPAVSPPPVPSTVPAPAAAPPAPRATPSRPPARGRAVAPGPTAIPRPPAVTPSPAPPVRPARLPAVAARRAGQPARQEGPLADPPRTAAIVAVLGVFVMTVSVGALSAAVRVR